MEVISGGNINEAAHTGDEELINSGILMVSGQRGKGCNY